ncbi:hypothetical protein [Nocardia rhamnosiphila]|uniref:hypothetical protein n=1 Tax=Nocardia rhamnosiphila TaxID=426716 RepID=UPI0004C3EDB5|nr:hypothetical protein [Nocardia rhamnosiphila]
MVTADELCGDGRAELPAPLHLPTGRPRPPASPYAGANTPIELHAKPERVAPADGSGARSHPNRPRRPVARSVDVLVRPGRFDFELGTFPRLSAGVHTGAC